MSEHSNMTNWGKQDTIGVFGVCFVLAATGFLGIGPPVVEALGREHVERALQQSTIEAQDLVIATSKVRKDQDEIDRRLAQSKVTFVPVTQLNARVLALVDLGEKVDLTVAQVTPAAPRPARQSIVVPLTMTGTGHYTQISELLARIHSQFPDIVVAGFSAEARRVSDPAGGAFVLELEWYAAPDAGAAPIAK